MPPQYLTTSGLEIPTVVSLKTQLGDDAKGTVDALIATEADSVAGEHDGIVASHLREGWEVIKIAYDGLDPNAAEDQRLDALCAITGTTRNPATYTTFKGANALTVELDDGAEVEAGVTMFALGASPETRFVATENFTNETGVTDTFPIEARSEFLGPVVANAGTVTVIATPATGLVSVTNTLDGTIGANIEGNVGLRRRRRAELRALGGTTAPALEAALLAYVDAEGNHPILAVEIIDNDDDVTDKLGVPPHSFEVILWDGVSAAVPDEDIWAIIKKHKPNGVKSFGETTDPTFKYSFTRAEPIDILMIVTLKKDPARYVGNAAVETLLAATGALEQKPAIGGDSGVVAFSDYLSSAHTATGVTRVTSVVLSYSGVSIVTNADLTIPARRIAVIDTSNIAIVATDDEAL